MMGLKLNHVSKRGHCCAGKKSIANDLFTMENRMGLGFDTESDTYNNNHFCFCDYAMNLCNDFGIPRVQQNTTRRIKIFITVYFHNLQAI